MTGTRGTQLVVLRGNSRSGKTSLSMALRDRPMSVVGQDHLRRIVLKESDTRTATDAIDLIDLTVRFCLDRGRSVVLEGILNEAKYGDMIRRLLAEHRGRNHVYYLQVDFAETVRRHDGSVDRCNWSADQLREWWRTQDLLGVAGEAILDANAPMPDTLSRIQADLDGSSRG